MLKEFKEFALKGNVMDMAIGIIIGVAFGGVIKSLVADVLMPPIGLLMGKVDFSQKFLNLGEGDYETLEAAKAAGAPVMTYGAFINTVINFIIVAFAIFLLVKAMNKAKKKEEAKPPPGPTKDQELLAEIRDALKK
ncbi:MAG: large conductance mechanosensitive channel protein MscL [Planctomycetota bacterium]|nr:large conductance mechanosensitive channel protein MscL [Planctomycetota bacterium]